MEVKNGYVLISDITGYTEFLIESELQHAKEILDTLLKTGVNSMRPPIAMGNSESDADEAPRAATVKPFPLFQTSYFRPALRRPSRLRSRSLESRYGICSAANLSDKSGFSRLLSANSASASF